MAIISRPYEVLVRFNPDGTMGAHYQEAIHDDATGRDIGMGEPQTIVGAKAVDGLLAQVSSIINAELAVKVQEADARVANVEATETELAEAKALIAEYEAVL